jgi:deaminated glutathione amidase
MTRIACLQIPARESAEAATEIAVELAEQAMDQGATVLCLPEYCGGLRTEGVQFAPPIFNETSHPLVQRMKALAAEKDVWILVGSVAVTGQDTRYSNRSIMIDDTGEVVARYDKLHLFDIDLGEQGTYRESDTVYPGDKAIVVDTPFGTVGMSVCYDLRFGGLYRDLAFAGSEILTVPAAFTKTTGEAHWHVLNRARAIETGTFVVAPCMIGEVPGGGAAYGHSLIIDPWGTVLADGGEEVGIAIADIDASQSKATRAKVPNLKHERSFGIMRLNAVRSTEVAAS